MALQLSSTAVTDDLSNPSSPAPRRPAFSRHRLSHAHLGSPPRPTIFQGSVRFCVCFFCALLFSRGETFLFADRMFHRQWTPNGFLPDSQPHSHLPSCSYLVFPGCELCDPSIGLGGLAPRLFGPTSTIPPLPLSEFVLIFFLGSLNPLGLVRDLPNQASDPSTASSPTT